MENAKKPWNGPQVSAEEMALRRQLFELQEHQRRENPPQRNGTKTHCIRGHDITPASGNVIWVQAPTKSDPNAVGRCCRQCKIERLAAARVNKRRRKGAILLPPGVQFGAEENKQVAQISAFASVSDAGASFPSPRSAALDSEFGTAEALSALAEANARDLKAARKERSDEPA